MRVESHHNCNRQQFNGKKISKDEKWNSFKNNSSTTGRNILISNGDNSYMDKHRSDWICGHIPFSKNMREPEIQLLENLQNHGQVYFVEYPQWCHLILTLIVFLNNISSIELFMGSLFLYILFIWYCFHL